MELAPDFEEFVESLIAHGVEFLVVGAYALAFHGAPRFTGDLGILVRPTLDNAERLLPALDGFGFPVTDLNAQQLVEPRRMLQVGVPPVPIHVMSTISGVGWDDGRETFLRNKRAAGRLQDFADIDALEPGRETQAE